VSPASQPTSSPNEAGSPARWPGAGWALLIFGATFAAYFPALKGKLVWDDSGHVTQPALQSLHGLWRIWFEVGATQQYYPVLHSAFWIEHRLWGDATLGYHLTNILLHAAAACLFVQVLRRLQVPGAYFAGLLFALHPVAVESVAWISEQKNTLSTVFYLLAALAYLRFDEERRWRWYGLASVLFALAALSKSVTVSLPAALLVIFWWKRGRLSWRGDVAPLAPWLAFGAAVGAFTGWVEHRFIGAQGSDFTLTGIERVLLAGRIVWFYLGKLFWPTGLVFIYPHWQMSAADAALYLYPIAALGLLAVLWAARHRSRAPLAAMLFFIGSLFPALGFFDVYPFRYSYVADHFQYLASLGIFALVAGAWAKGSGRCSLNRDSDLARNGPTSWLLSMAAVLVLGLFGVMTWRRSHTYADADTLYRATLAGNPDSWLAHNNLANDLLASGQGDEAIYHYQQAQRLESAQPEAANNLGIALGRVGRAPEAIVAFEQALRLRPDYAEAHYNLGVALASVGRLVPAIAHFDAALRLSPNHAEIHEGLGMALARTNRFPEAIEQLEQAVALRSDDVTAYLNLGIIFRLLGRNDEAMRNLEQALRFQPNSPEAHYNLSLILRADGRVEAADAEMAEAIRLKSGTTSP
jgi:protein O-mannosyl-transferase